MATFIQSFDITMGNEGGYADNPMDSGGETYAGITQRFWPNWKGWALIDSVKAQHPANLNAVLKSLADLQTAVELFYKTNFWNPLSLDNLLCQQIGNQVFDAGVNMGVGTASLLLQRAINSVQPGAVVIDGIIGPKTVTAANALNNESLYNQFILLRRQRYMQIIAHNPNQAEFEHDWLARLTPYNSALDGLNG